MRLVRTDSFRDDFRQLPEALKRQTEKALSLLAANPRHPSLRTHKLRGIQDPMGRDLWSCRVSRGYRILFAIAEDAYLLYRVGPHKLVE